MKKKISIICLLSLAILVFGCSQEKSMEPLVGPVTEQFDPAEDSEKCFFPRGYYSIYWPPESTTGVSLERINRRNGQGTFIWDFQIPDAPDYPYYDENFWGISPFGIAFDRGGALYALLVWLNPAVDYPYTRLAQVDLETGQCNYIGDPIMNSFAGPEMDRCGNIYATGFQVGDPAAPPGSPPFIHGDDILYRIDKDTGIATAIGSTGRTDWMDLEFDRRGRLWATVDNELWILDTDTGEPTFMTEIHGVPQQDIPDCCEEDWPYMMVMSIAHVRGNIMMATSMRGFSMCEQVNCPVMKINIHTGNATVIGYTNQAYNHGGDFLRHWTWHSEEIDPVNEEMDR